MPGNADPSSQTPPDATKPLNQGDGDKLPHLIVQRQPAGNETNGTLATARRMINGSYAPFVPAVLALVMLGGVIGLYFQPPGLRFLFRILDLTPGGGTTTPIAVAIDARSARKDATGLAGPKDTDVIVGLGKLIPTGDVVIVAPPFGAGDARIAALKVKEGDRVAKGDILAVMDNESQLRARIETARAAVQAKAAILAQTLASVRISRDEAQAALGRATATARNAQRDLDRIEKLYKDGFSTLAMLDQKRTTRDETVREVERSQAFLSRWDSAHPDQQPDVVVAQRTVDAARADFLRAEHDLDQAYVKAPINGTVLSIASKLGERPGRAGVMDIGDIDKMTVEIEIYQTRISHVSVGDSVRLNAEALPASLTAHITRIGLEIGRQALIDASPAANTDARVVKVYADLDPESSKAARNFTNLQVTARITPRDQK